MRLVLLILLLLPSMAHAMGEALQIAGTALMIFGNPWFAVLGFIMTTGAAVYGAAQARKAAEAQREAARQAYNAGLRDRTVTRVATDAPHRYVYGRARVGSDIVAIFTSGSRDEYKHLVCVHAAHECDAIEEVYVAGKALGTLDGNGDVTGGDYFIASIASVTTGEAHTGTTFTLAHTPVPGSLRVTYIDIYDQRVTMSYTISGADVTVATSYAFTCYYDYPNNTSRVRVTKHLGTPTDPADAALMALLPTKWLNTATLRGFCYTVIRLDLNQTEFQSGIPPIEVLLRGKKLYDPRDATITWKSNPALTLYDYLTSELCGVAATDLPAADYITAANVCDEDIGGGVKRYTINGTVTSDQDQRKTIESLAQCMAGYVIGTTWSVLAGKYVAPVMALEQSDIVGTLSVIGGTPDADLYNGVKGAYIGAENSYVATDIKPFQNAAYVAADGRELWTSIEFPFTDSVQRAHNLARIFTEDQRNGFTLKGAFSLKTWVLKIGQRITFTSTLLGQSGKIYRLTDKRFSPEQAVELTFKEDTASIWDLADAVTADSTPNTNLPNPFTVGLCGNVQMAETIYETTGSAGVRSKATLSWDAPADVSVTDYELEYKPYASGAWNELFNVRGTFYDFYDLAPGKYDFRVKARNVLGAVGEYTAIKTFEVFGLIVAPADMTGFSVRPMAGMALATWNRTTDLDVKIGGGVVICFSALTLGASWADAVVIPNGLMNGDATSALIPLATGTYLAKFVDSTGHYSDNAASFVVTEALVSGWTTVATSTQHTSFTGAKTGVVAVDGVLILDGTELFDSAEDFDNTAIFDNIGDIVASGEYLFDATMDLSTIATRRFHARIKSLSYDTGDLFDSAEIFDSAAELFDGTVVNDTSATVYAKLSNDDATYTEWTPFMVADFNCRYAKFRALLTSGSVIHNIQLSELSVTAKILT